MSMSAATKKTIATVVAGVLMGIAVYVPQAAPFSGFLTFVAGLLSGGVHLPRPGDVKAT